MINYIIEGVESFGWKYLNAENSNLLFERFSCSSTSYKMHYNKENNIIEIEKLFYGDTVNKVFRGKINQIDDIRTIGRMVVL